MTEYISYDQMRRILLSYFNFRISLITFNSVSILSLHLIINNITFYTTLFQKCNFTHFDSAIAITS